MGEKTFVEKSYWLHALSPIHIGAGRGLGYIDLPVVREKVTNWPYIPGSSVKGVIAAYYNVPNNSEERKGKARIAFGATGDDCSNSGSLVFTDAHILCLPVRSFYGTFAWITSPFCLERCARDVKEHSAPPVILPDEFQAFTAQDTALTKEPGGKVYLEHLDLASAFNENAENWAEKIAQTLFGDDEGWKKTFKSRFAVVHDDIFTFLCEAGTEVTPHIKVDQETGAAADGALWYEETLPVETLLVGRVWCDKIYGAPEDETPTSGELLKQFCGSELSLQLGGKATTGKGHVRCLFKDIEKAGELHG